MKPPSAIAVKPWHVVLAPVIPILAYVSANRDQIPPVEIVRPAAGAIAIVLVAWAVFAFLVRNRQTAGLVVTLLTIVILSHSTIVALMALIGVRRLYFLVDAGLIAGCGAFLWKRGDVRRLTLFVNLWTMIIAVLFAIPLAWSEMRRPVLRAPAPVAAPARNPQDLPDVYVMILDAYGRADVLHDLYGLEEGFAPTLESLGFRVSRQARANYSQTALAFASALNLDYLPALATPAEFAGQRRSLTDLIARNRLFRSFKAAGYRIRAYESEYALVQFDEADETPGRWISPTQLEYRLYDDSLIPVLARQLGMRPASGPLEMHRRNVNWLFRDLAVHPNRGDTPTLVFAHILMPHPPFVVNADGSQRFTNSPVTFADGTHWRFFSGEGSETYRSGYADAVRFVNTQIATIVRTVTNRTKRPTIFYIQGDHGPGLELDQDSAERTNLHERMGILLAMKLTRPSSFAEPFPVTPVNGFRFLLNRALASELPALPDRSYFSTWKEPFDFRDVTAQVDASGS